MQALAIKKGDSAQVQRVSIVLATWCPHCVPLSLENAGRLAKELGASYRVLDIDKPGDSTLADELVRKYGDYVEDYIIPQVFLEFKDGRVIHIFTGFSENTEVTKARWADLFKSAFLRDLKENA